MKTILLFLFGLAMFGPLTQFQAFAESTADVPCTSLPPSDDGHLGCRVAQIKSGPTESVIYDQATQVVVEPAASSRFRRPGRPVEADALAWATTPGTVAEPRIQILEFGSPYCEPCKVAHQAMALVSQACTNGNVKVAEGVDGGIWENAKTPAQAHSQVPELEGCPPGEECKGGLRAVRLWSAKSQTEGTLVSPARVPPTLVYPPDPPSGPSEMEREFKAMGIDGVTAWPTTVVLVNGRVAYLHRGGYVDDKTLSVANERAAAKKMVDDMRAGVARHLPPGVTKGLECNGRLIDGTAL
jgi:hypothetical protein